MAQAPKREYGQGANDSADKPGGLNAEFVGKDAGAHGSDREGDEPIEPEKAQVATALAGWGEIGNISRGGRGGDQFAKGHDHHGE